MGEYQRLPNGDDLCLDHIKLYDRYFEHWSHDLPSRALSNRVTKHTHIKHIYGQSLPRTILFCIHRSSAVYRPTIGWQSSVFLGRATIGRRSDDSSLIEIHVYMYTNGVRKRCSFLDGHGSFACVVKYLIAIVYGRFTLAIVMVKWPYTIGIKYLTSKAKLPFPSRKLHLLRTPF